MHELALTMPGMLSARDDVAEDGERVAIIELDSAENNTPRCPSASLRGPDLSIQICIVERSSEFHAPL